MTEETKNQAPPHMTQEQIIDSAKKFEKHIKKFGKGSFDMTTEFPTVPDKDIDTSWVRGVNQILFQVAGVSAFFSALAYRCNYHFSFALPTAGAYVSKGKFHVVMNPWFMFEYLNDPAWRAFVLMHEVVHIFYDHGHRRKHLSYDHQLWNQATDYYINLALKKMANELRQQDQGMMQPIPPEVFPLCLSEEFDGMTEDEIYAALLQESEEQRKQQQQQGESGNGDGQPQEGDGDEEGDGDGQPGQGQGRRGQKALDGGSDGNENGDDANNGHAISSAVRAAYTAQESSGQAPGSTEADMIRRCMEVTDHQVNWKQELADFVISTSKELSTYNKVSRRSSGRLFEPLFPSYTGDHISVYFGIDTSGSMSEEDITYGLNELRGVVSNFTSHRVFVSSCSVSAYKAGEIDSEEGTDFNVGTLDLRGGGGTRMGAMVEDFQYLMDNGDEEFDVAIIFTDGHLMEGDIENEYDADLPLLVVVTPDGNKSLDVPSANRVIYME